MPAIRHILRFVDDGHVVDEYLGKSGPAPIVSIMRGVPPYWYLHETLPGTKATNWRPIGIYRPEP